MVTDLPITSSPCSRRSAAHRVPTRDDAVECFADDCVVGGFDERGKRILSQLSAF
jgi:hypothetical protein